MHLLRLPSGDLISNFALSEEQIVIVSSSEVRCQPVRVPAREAHSWPRSHLATISFLRIWTEARLIGWFLSAAMRFAHSSRDLIQSERQCQTRGRTLQLYRVDSQRIDLCTNYLHCSEVAQHHTRVEVAPQ